MPGLHVCLGLLLPRGLLFLLSTKSLVLRDQQGIQHTPWQRGRARRRWDQLTCDLKGEPTSPDGGDGKITHKSILNCAWHTASAQETNCCSCCPLGPFSALFLPQVEHCLKCISYTLGYLSQPRTLASLPQQPANSGHTRDILYLLPPKPRPRSWSRPHIEL